MDLSSIYNDDIASVEVNTGAGFIQIIWFKHPNSEDFRKIITTAHTYAGDHKLTKWLCNMQEVLFLEISDQDWLVHEVFASLNANYKYEFAYVISPIVLEVMTIYHIQDMVNSIPAIKNKLLVEIFFEVDEAQQWLFSSVKTN
ncbi:MAG: hypothetical protein M3142_02825 [Bacteroidota bacterium]|nr:hypothetical protein [Bacteroidota bacterium]